MLIRRVHSKSYHSECALTQVIILQLPFKTTPEGVTLYICTLFGSPDGNRTRDNAVTGRCDNLFTTELYFVRFFIFLHIYYIIFFLFFQKRFFKALSFVTGNRTRVFSVEGKCLIRLTITIKSELL